MNKTKMVIGTGAGIAASLLLLSKPGKKIVGDSYNLLKDKVNRVSGKTEKELNELKSKVSEDIKYLGEDVKSRIMDILDESVKSGKKIKKGLTKEMHL